MILFNCDSQDENLADLGYGKEIPYATGVLKPTIVSYNGNKLVLDLNFILFNDKGIVPISDFTLERPEAVFNNGTRMTFNLLSLEKFAAQPSGCYDATIVLENNSMERPERLELATRYIFKNTPECSHFNFAYYPERNESLEVIDDYQIERSRFINDPFEFDYTLAEISYRNFEMFQKMTPVEKSTQLSTLDAVLKFTIEKSTAPSKQILMMYENYNAEQSSQIQNMVDLAVNNGITININKNDLKNDDALLNVAYQTGGIYFIQEEYDSFQPRNQPDSYVMALHAADFLSGNYDFYRARYEITTTGTSFTSNYWFRLYIDINLPNDVSKQLPLYVYIP